MAKIKNTFIEGIIDKDADKRFAADQVMTDAENFTVLTTDGSDRGVGRNFLGNVQKTNYDIQGAETIGSGINESKNKIYNFIKGDLHDYIIEYDIVNNISTIILQDVTGGVLNFIEGEPILNVDLISSGEEDEDLLAWSGDSNPPRIVNIERAKTWGLSGFTDLDISVMKPSPIFAPTLTPEQLSNDDLASFMRDKFLTFSYRYRYEDGFYSAFSSWTPYAFIPGILDIDVLTSSNISMQNNAKAFNISFNTGPRSVLDVELLFKMSNSQTTYSIIKLNKEEEGLADNIVSSFLFDTYKVHKVLSEEQFFRSFDNVPLSAVAQTIIGSRLTYANYLEGRNIDSPVDFSVTYDSVLSNEYSNSEIENRSLDATSTNVIDYWGESDIDIIDGGAGIVMDYATNILTFTNVYSEDQYFRFNPRIFKQDLFSSYELTFDIYVDGLLYYTGVIPAGVLSFAGSFIINNSLMAPGVSKEIYIAVRSEEPILYYCQLICAIIFSIPIVKSQISFDTNDYFLISKPNTIDSGTQVGNVIPLSKFDLTFDNFSFTTGSNYLFDFDIVLAYLFNTNLLDSYTFDYLLSDNYEDFTDFIDNSNFIASLQTFFENVVLNPENQIPSSSILSYIPANIQVNYLDEIVNIEMPIRQIEVEEPSGVILEKTDYLLCKFVTVKYSSTTLFRSMHSSRDYEIGIIFLDEQGRKTTVLDSKDNSLFISAENSITQNTIIVETFGNPPSWAKYYKFAVKYNKSKYEVIYASEMYNDGIYSYIKLISDNKSKIKEGDYLVVKADLRGPLSFYVKVKVLEMRNFTEDEIVEDSTVGDYFKIKNGNFDLELNDNDFLDFIGKQGTYLNPYYVESQKITYNDGSDISFVSGNIVRFQAYCNRLGNELQKFDNKIDQKYYLSASYSDFREMFDAVIAPSQPFLDFINGDEMTLDPKWTEEGLSRNQISFKPRTSRAGKRNIRTQTNVYITTSQLPIFETIPLDSFDTTYIETSETYSVIDGEYEFTSHKLNGLFNCYCFGNGAESISIRDELSTNYLNLDYGFNAVSEDEYKQVRRFADVTYSEIFNSNTNVNRLNEFNLSLANFKDDIEKSYGPIYKIEGEDTNLEVYQEDIDSIVYYGKDLLFNADGTTNLTGTPQVLGQQKMYAGEYGISANPESYASYGIRKYHSDIKRGVVIRKSTDGLTEISFYGMRNYFKSLFRDNTITRILGEYDQFHDLYYLNVKFINSEGLEDYVTWAYSDIYNGWLTRVTFNPEAMLRINNEFISFKNGEVYFHNQKENYNTFYNEETASSFEFNFSQEPSIRKRFHTLEIEGTDSWDISMKTDLDSGYIDKEDFELKEGVFYSYIRANNDQIDTSLLSTQGIGNCEISGVVLSFNNNLDSVISVGDIILNENTQLVGTILSKTDRTITLDTVNNIVSGSFVMSAKAQSIENNGLLGYYMAVKMTIMKSDETEIFCVNSEVSKSNQ